jgi:hypothetical protein
MKNLREKNNNTNAFNVCVRVAEAEVVISS